MGSGECLKPPTTNHINSGEWGVGSGECLKPPTTNHQPPTTNNYCCASTGRSSGRNSAGVVSTAG
ncbi:MAG: hypothetical protein DSM106950_03520 [Stigonema ocellatum SAG 48.90 = DSM 106950]|nr:hypothetical protein [Stigonema ocellatum SAG 48.90 = DSM 106950]